MHPKVTLSIVGQNLRLIMGDPGPVILYILIPALSMIVMRPTQEQILQSQGFEDANGSEQVVPGFIVMFIFLWIISVGRAFFVEHGWGTWDRLRASAAGPVEIVLGKLVPGFLLIAGQIVISMAVGILFLDLNSEGPMLALVVVAIPLILCVLAMTAAFVALTQTYAQLEAAGNGVMIVFAAVGGALTPVSILPQAVQDIAPALPSYWALDAARNVLLEGDGVSAVLPAAGMLMLFTVFFAAIAAVRFSVGQAKAIEI